MNTSISRRQFARVVLAGGLAYPLLPVSAHGAKYDDADFLQWMQQQEDEFASFSAFYETAFADYQKGIEVNWGANPLLRSQSVWVDYSDDTQRTIDFEQGFAEVILIQTEGQSVAALAYKAKEAIQQLFTQTQDKLLANDPLELAIKQQLKTKGNALLANAKAAARAAKKSVFGLFAPDTATIKQAEVKEKKLSNGKKVVVVRVPINNKTNNKREALLPAIQASAERYQLPPALISAIIQAESSFNPLATSRIPAYGLMQVVPTSAGIDVADYLFKEKRLLSPEWLYNADNNILAGSTYLHLLHSRYLKRIHNPTSKTYCAIASYNTGAGNMAKAFSSRGLSSAVKKINRMPPDKVYLKLVRNLPYEETQHYLKRVVAYMGAWKAPLKC